MRSMSHLTTPLQTDRQTDKRTYDTGTIRRTVTVGAVVQLVEYQTRNQEVAG